MRSKIFIILLLALLVPFTLDNLIENKYYFQVFSSENKSTPYISDFYDPNNNLYKINSTSGDNPKILGKTIGSEIPIKYLSSKIQYENSLLIKTCFGPNKIIEIIDENNEIFIPKDDYFKNVKNNLDNIKYCYSTIVMNPSNTLEKIILTYWTEFTINKNEEIYNHKYIIFYPNKKTFTKVYSLKTEDNNNFYAQSCTNMRNIYIYCNIPSSNSFSEKYHFYIDTTYLTLNSLIIKKVIVNARFSNAVYHKPISLVKSEYTTTGKQVEYFLMEYHDKTENKTRLMTSIFVKSYGMSLVMKYEELNVYKGINIEDIYIEPSLFNHFVPNSDELIFIYIMKGAEGKNILLLNRYDNDESLKSHSNFEKYSMSNYLRDDICKNPKYMQSWYINSFINYNDQEKEIMEYNPGNYFKYQKDIGILITCDNGNGQIEYETKKIPMPQCLNELEDINGKSNIFTFTSDKTKIILDINGEPNLRSLRNVEIEFFDSLLYNHFIIVQYVKNGERSNPISNAIKISNIDYLEISRTLNFRKGKKYKLYYRIIQTGLNGVSSTCHLTSNLCYLELNYKDDNNNQEPEDYDCTVKYCKECEKTQCIQCQDIIGILLNSKDNECTCDVDNGFKKEPKLDINMCICKDNYSFYKNITRCLPDFILNSGKFCIVGQDDRSLINIYDDIKPGMTKYMKNGLPYCKGSSSVNKGKWFDMGKYVFYWAKIENCVYITFNNAIVMYSNRSECGYKYYDYKAYLDIDIKNENEYYSLLDNAYEYQPNDDNNSLIIDKDNIKFFILNNHTSNNYSSISLSQRCIDIIKEENNLPSLLIFVANIKRENMISTQVEYNFYNSIPEYINQKLDLNSCYSNELKNNIDKRILQNEENQEEEKTDININNTKITINLNNNSIYDINLDEIIINIQIDWTEKQRKNIEELYIKRGIDFYNSSIDFYTDECNKFTSPEGTDMYLNDRKEKYYIYDPICETGCVQIGYEKYSNRALCKCKIKNSTENYENVTFSPNELDEKFTKKYILPNNIRVVLKCFFKALKANSFKEISGLLFSLFLIIFFVKLNVYRFYKYCSFLKKCCCFCKKKNKENNNNNINNDNNDNNNKSKKRNIKNKGKNIKKEDKKEDKKDKLFTEFWETPFKSLKGLFPHNDEIDNINKNSSNLIDNNNNLKLNENKSNGKEEKNKIKFKSQLIINTNNQDINDDSKKSESKDTNSEISRNSNNSNKIMKLKENSSITKKKDKKQNDNYEKEQKQSLYDINNDDDNENNINNETKKKSKSLFNKMVNNNSVNDDEDSKDSNDETEKKSEKNNNYAKYTKKDSKSTLIQENDNNNKEEDKKEDEKESKKNDDELIKITKKKKKKKKVNKGKKSDIKANPPPNTEERTERENQEYIRLSHNDNNNDRNKEEKNCSKCEDLIYFHIKNYKTKDKDITIKSTTINIFLSKIMSYSIILFFIIPYPDQNDIYAKLSTLILTISIFMSFNILTEFKLTTLHLSLHKDEENSSDFFDVIYNLFLPSFCLYITLACIKKALSTRDFYIEKKHKIENLKKNRGHGTKFEILRHNEETDIKQFRNIIQDNSIRVCIIGFILLLINWYLVTTFCGIYHNSFGCVIVNVITSMISTVLIFIIFVLLETLFINKCCKCFSLKNIINCCYPCCCCLCHSCYDYDKKDYDGYLEDDDDDDNNDNNDNDGGDNNIITNQTNTYTCSKLIKTD